jgi:trigger factor
MQVTETLTEGLKHEFKISVPASDLDAKAGAKLIDLKDKVRLNGFRPGKVPVSHLKKVYGRSVMAETIDQTIRDTNTQIFTDRGFRLATEPKITMPTEEKEVEELLAGKTDLTYTVAIEVVPTIQLADFKSFSVEKPVVEVSDADVDEAIKRIAVPITRRARAPRPRTAIASPSTSRAPSTACRSTAAPARASRS